MQSVQTHTAKISILKEGIVLLKFNDVVEYDEQNARINLETESKLAGGVKYLSLVDCRCNLITESKTHAFLASEEAAKYRIAVAVLIETLAVRLSSRFYISHYQPIVPTKIFTNEEEAKLWLLTFKK